MSKEFKFKIGDKVRRIDNEFGQMKIGSIYTVVDVMELYQTYAIQVEGVEGLWGQDCFELVEDGVTEGYKYQVGDHVQVVRENGTDVWFSAEDLPINGVVMHVNQDEDEDRYYVKLEGYKGTYDNGYFAFNDEHLILLQKEDDEYKVKVGETVRYLGNDTPRLKNGSKHKVIAVDRCGELTLQWVSGYWNPDDFEVVTEEDVETTDGIVSDGGSSDYYFTKLPKHLIDKIVKTGGIEIKDIARYVYDNNADAFNIIKAEKRIIESKKGKGKAGTTMLYDANKIIFFANEQLEALTNEGNV